MSSWEGEPDRGAPRERTALAWNRAALVVVANGALLIRIGDVRGNDLLDAAGAAVTAGGVALWLLSLVRYAAKMGHAAAHLIAGRSRTVRALAAFTALVSLLEIAVVASTHL